MTASSTPTLQLFEPAMCCPSGTCGATVDPVLVRLNQDLAWLAEQGIVVERFNLTKHPTIFTENDLVRDALEQEGVACLPLVVQAGEIVHRGSYPDRTELAAMTGLSVSDMATPQADAPSACGPGCACSDGTAGSAAVKKVVSAIAVLAVVAILIYKASAPGSTQSQDGPASATSFGDLVEKPTAASESAGRPAGRESSPVATTGSDGAAVPSASKTGPSDANKEAPEPSAQSDKPFGAALSGFARLAELATDKDAVLIYVPDKDGAVAAQAVVDSAHEAVAIFARSNMDVGTFVLESGSQDYQEIAARIPPASILVANKTGGMSVVSGEISSTRIMQAFLATRQSGCGAGGCGPSSGGCN